MYDEKLFNYTLIYIFFILLENVDSKMKFYMNDNYFKVHYFQFNCK